MSLIKKTVSRYLGELTFLRTFIAALTQADTRIECETEDLAEQFATEGNTPHFTLLLNGQTRLIFERGGALPGATNYYTVCEQQTNTQGFLLFSGNIRNTDEVCIRSWKFALVANDELLRLELASYDGGINQSAFSVLNITLQNVKAFGVCTGNDNVLAQELICDDDSVIQKNDRLGYCYEPEHPERLELIRSKVFLDADSSGRRCVSEKMLDTSSVTANQLLRINGRNYYSLDAHTITEV